MYLKSAKKMDKELAMLVPFSQKLDHNGVVTEEVFTRIIVYY